MPPLTGGTGLKPSEDGLSPSLKMTTAMTLLAIKTFRCVWVASMPRANSRNTLNLICTLMEIKSKKRLDRDL
jgi:hypothetical protein